METMKDFGKKYEETMDTSYTYYPLLFASPLIIDQFSNCEVYYEKNYIDIIIGGLYLKNKSDVNMIMSIRYKAIFI